MILFLFGALLPCVYILNITGAAIETNWLYLWATLPLLLFSVRIRTTPAHQIGAIFLAWAALSALWAQQWFDAVEKTMFIGTVACAFLLGAESNDRRLFEGLAVGIAVNSAVAVAQYLGVGMALTGGTPAGLLYNGNALAEPAALVALVFLLDGRVLWALPTIPAIVLPGTRAGFAILAVGFLAWLWQRSRLAATACVIAVALALATFGPGRVPSTEQRVAIWQDTLAGLTVFGHGLGSFVGSYPRYATHIDTSVARPFHAHSDILEVTFELGLPGLTLFAALCAACWRRARPRERVFLLACLGLVATDFPLNVPTTAFMVAFMAGRGAAGWRQDGVAWDHSGSSVPQRDAAWRSLWNNPSLGAVPIQPNDPNAARVHAAV